MKTKKIKRWLSTFLCMLLGVGLLPTVVLAAEYGVTVNGLAVTESNAGDVLGDSTVSYDAATNTLTLNGANLTQIQNNTGKAFTIKVSGTNTVAITSGTADLIESNSPLNITGDAGATLKLSGANQNSYIECIDAEGSVTVEIITLVLTNSNNAGISTTGDITVQNGAVVKGDTGNMFYATTPGAGKLTVTDSTVIAPLEGTSVSGWMSAWVNEMDISKSTVDITVANGIYATNNVIIRDGSNVKVTASGKVTPYPGIFAGGSMTITDSTVEGVSYTYSGLYAVKDLVITDSTIKAVTTSTEHPAIRAKGNLKINGVVTMETEAASGAGYDGNVVFEVRTPAEPADQMYDVYTGTSVADAAELEDSPFAANTNITEYVKDSPYFSIAAHVHSGGTATCTSGPVCIGCGNAYGNLDPANHTNLVKTEAKAATHLQTGNKEYWHCDGCKKYFSDAAGTTEIALESTVIPKLPGHTADDTGWHSDEANHWNTCECGETLNKAAHSYEWVIDKEATATEAGSKHEECTVCGYEKAAVEIPATGTDIPQTGDSSHMFMWIMLALLSGGGVLMLALKGRKKTNQ